MKRIHPLLFAIAVLTACTSSTEHRKRPDVKPPVAEKAPFEIVASHGKKRVDNYYWLRNREDSSVINYLKAENAYVDTMMAHTETLQEKLFQEMKSRIKEDDSSVPYKLDNYFFYRRYEEGNEYPIYCRKKDSMDAPEEVVVNGNELAKGHSFFNLQVKESPDHRIANLIVDTVGRRFYTIKFRDMTTGKMLPDKIGETEGDVEWFNDNKTVLYTRQDPETLIANKVYKHVLGTKPENDVLVYAEKDSTLECFIFRSRSDRYLFISSGRTDASEQRYLDANNVSSKPVLIEPLKENVEYYADNVGDKFYIRTNLNAKNYRLVEAPVSSPGKENWKDVVPNRDNILLEEYELFENFLALAESNEGLTSIRLIRWSDNSEHTINFKEPSYYAAIAENPEFHTDVIRYEYESLTTPGSIYDHNMVTQKDTLMKRQEVPGNFNPEDYKVERVMATAHDGKKIPMSVVYRKNKFNKDGTNPCLQYGYGSYGYSMPDYFNSNIFSLLDRGFVYAIAHIRGGQEMGGGWYEDGKMMHKKNTFTDFIDCSEFLISNNYADREKLFAYGGSAGGLLMGAITNMRPDLYKGVIAAVPFVDVVTTMMDETIPLTTFEWKEWGNPNIPEEYEYMLSYSPYDNVEKKDYPNMLVTTGLHDSQVQYWEPAKWVAKLRDFKTDNNLLLFRTNMSAGHGGSSGRFERLKETALVYAFALDLVGIND